MLVFQSKSDNLIKIIKKKGEEEKRRRKRRRNKRRTSFCLQAK